jgi:chromosome partitioning protein
MAVVITIANEKGGVGKSTTAVNLAAGISLKLRYGQEDPQRVLLIDLDPQMNALMGVAYKTHVGDPGATISEMLLSEVPLSPQRFIRKSAHHPNLHFIPSENRAQKVAAQLIRDLPAPDLRLSNAIEPLLASYAYVIIDTPPNAGTLLNNAIMASSFILIPIEMSYQGATGLGNLHTTIATMLKAYKRTNHVAVGYLPTMYEEAARDAVEIYENLQQRYQDKVFDPIHRARAIQQANGAHLDIFLYKPPRTWSDGQIESSSRATQEYGLLVNRIMALTDRPAA